MRTIPLTGGRVALVDDQDFSLVDKFQWRSHWNGRDWYARGYIKQRPRGEPRKSIYMHRLILGFPESDVDHRDRNPLNNQRDNLRPSTRTENQGNSRKHRDARTSHYKGVYFKKATNRWQAQIVKGKRLFYLGAFEKEIDAAKAYDYAAREYFGEFVHCNFPE